MRLFVALDIAEEIQASLLSYADRVGNLVPGVRWMPPETWHVTLKFIGERKDPESIKKSLSFIESAPFPVTFRGVGFFTPRAPRVFWAGLEPSAELSALAAVIEEALLPLGLARDEHPFTPHLTLARTGSGRPHGESRDRVRPTLHALRSRIEADKELSQPDFGTMTATEFHLYRSIPSPGGAEYSRLATFGLNGPR